MINNHTKQNLNDNCIHDWYRFVLAYPDHLVTEIIERFAIQPGQRVLDPFVGTGTTLVECKKNGITAIGIDSNPVTAFASQVKTSWDVDLQEFARRRDLLLSRLRSAMSSFPSESDEPKQLAFDHLTSDEFVDTAYTNSEPIVDIDAIKALIPKDAMSDIPLRKILTARELIADFPDDTVTDIFRLALMSVAVNDASNLGFGPEVYVKRKKRPDADVYTALAKKLSKIEDDLRIVLDIPSPGQTIVHTGDARKLAHLVCDPVDYVITSPPYPNEKDYTRTTRLELVLLNYINDRRDLRRLKESMLRSHTRNIYAKDRDSTYIEDIPEIQTLAQDVERKRIECGATSGFERLYHRVVTEYFGGMYRVLQQLEQVVRPGGKLAFVVGDQMSYFQVPIETAKLLSLIACRKLAYREIDTLLWRTRLATATKRQVEEHILVLERQ